MEKIIVIGKFIYNERGFGFVEFENEQEDIFIPPDKIKDSMNGDIVKVEIQKKAGTDTRAEGKIVEVIRRATITIVGTYQKSKNYGFVVSDDYKLGTDIFISKSHQRKAKNGDKVVAKIIKYPEKGKSAEGQIIEILGKANDSSVDFISVVRSHQYSLTYPKAVEKEAKILPEVVHGIDGRIDLREQEIFTIDGDDTKDIDDAVSLRKKGNHYILGVHIADVSYYVHPDTAIDKEAVKRGTSVYLINKVIPMLPKKLSNGICSLNPNEDRYALSVEIELDDKGKVIYSKVFKSIICSKIQMTYNKVYEILEENKDYPEYRSFIPTLQLMRELAEILIKKKTEDGAIDFNMPEAKIILDENDKVIDIGVREITIANRMIEQFMILANEVIAKTFFQKGVPFIYRVHEKPDIDRIDKLNNLLKILGYKEITKTTHQEIKHMLELCKGKEEEKIVSLMLLRTMQLAKYSNENIGHFGLASSHYCHFTSPIRRYPDLFIHRVISDYLEKELNKKKISKYKRQASKYAEIASEREQEEEEAERELYEIKKCEYMQNHIGEEFEGNISGVTDFGLFIELPNTIEGLCRVEDMRDDYYFYNEDKVQLSGKHTGKVYQLGDKIKVKCIAANKYMRRIQFEIV